jgi:hypothetical protein
MGFMGYCGKGVLGLTLVGAVVVGVVAGCQTGPVVKTQKLAKHQVEMEKEGLADVQTVGPLKVTAAPPEGWFALKTYKGALYTHQQWRSPTRATGVGVVYIKLPIPLPVGTLLWFAKQEYTKKESEGKLIAQWADKFGRSWFEAENNKYHVKGYAVVQGNDAWIVYSGWRTTMGQRSDEIALAERCQETVLVGTKVAEGGAGVARAE